jgi:general secretion pathway protein A
MYLEQFGLKEIPFSIAPDPRYLYMSEGHREALAHLLYGMNGEGGFVLLTGEVGTGKTTVCRCILEKVPGDTEIAFVLHPTLTSGELLAAICDEFRISYPEGTTSIKVFVDRINAYLLEAHASGKRAVLIIEEAQNLSAEVLEQLRLLTNLETNQRKLLQIILLGQPELRDMLARRELLQVAQRVTARYHLGPLSKNEIGAYMAHRLSVAGCDRRLFPPSLAAKIFSLSGGVPRVINVLCDRALLGAFVEGKQSVDRKTLIKAAREALGENDRQGVSRLFRWATAGIIMAAVIALSAFAYYRFNPPATDEKAGTFPAEARKHEGNAWQQTADYLPLLFLKSPTGQPAAPQGPTDFMGLQAGASEGTGPHENELLPAVADGETKKQSGGRSVHVEGDEAGKNETPGVAKADGKGTDNVLHP